MKNLLFLFACLFCLPVFSNGQENFYYPLDVVYDQTRDLYYVSNSAEGEGGFVRKMNTSGEITGTLISGLDYAGGMCLIEDVLYLIDNGDQFGGSLPSYVVAVDVESGNELFRTEISSGGTYLGLMTTDNNGNLFITDNEKMCIYKYNILTQTATTFLSDILQPHGIFYDHLADRIIFTENKQESSRLKAVHPDGGDVSIIYWYPGWLKGIVMNEEGEYFMTTWEWEGNWGDESVFKMNNELNGWMVELMDDKNRPYGLCMGHDNYLAVCAWGGHEVALFDLTLYGTGETIAQGEHLEIYPNPGKGQVKVKLPEIQSSGTNLKILDLSGRVLHERAIAVNESAAEVSLDLTFLPAGIYVMMVQEGPNMHREKLVIQ
jgi:hypothetical protein